MPRLLRDRKVRYRAGASPKVHCHATSGCCL